MEVRDFLHTWEPILFHTLLFHLTIDFEAHSKSHETSSVTFTAAGASSRLTAICFIISLPMYLGAISTDTAGAQKSFGVGVFRVGIFKYQMQDCRRGVCVCVLL